MKRGPGQMRARRIGRHLHQDVADPRLRWISAYGLQPATFTELFDEIDDNVVSKAPRGELCDVRQRALVLEARAQNRCHVREKSSLVVELFSASDVERGSSHSQRPAVLVPVEDLSACENPDPAVRPCSDPMFRFELGCTAFKVVGQPLFDSGQSSGWTMEIQWSALHERSFEPTTPMSGHRLLTTTSPVFTSQSQVAILRPRAPTPGALVTTGAALRLAAARRRADSDAARP